MVGEKWNSQILVNFPVANVPTEWSPHSLVALLATKYSPPLIKRMVTEPQTGSEKMEWEFTELDIHIA